MHLNDELDLVFVYLLLFQLDNEENKKEMKLISKKLKVNERNGNENGNGNGNENENEIEKSPLFTLIANSRAHTTLSHLRRDNR